MKRKDTEQFILIGSDAITFLESMLAGVSNEAPSRRIQPLDFDHIKKMTALKKGWMSRVPRDRAASLAVVAYV